MKGYRAEAKARKVWLEASRLLEKHEFNKAYPLLWKLRKMMPSDPNVLHNLGACALQTKRYGVAIENLERLIGLNPSVSIDDFCMLASAYHGVGNHANAIGLLEKVCASSEATAPRILLARMLIEAKRFQTASDLLLPLAKAPDATVKTLDLYATALEAQEHYFAAAAVLEKLITVEPENSSFRSRRAHAFVMVGDVSEAIDEYREMKIRGLDSDVAFSKILFSLHYLETVGDDALAREHDKWVKQFCRPADAPSHGRKYSVAGRPLRLGYISGDFCLHVVSSFFEPVLEAHDRTRVSVFCYSNSETVDWMTERLSAHANHWRDIVGKTDGEVVQMVRNDELDVLVELSGHTVGNRLKPISSRLAPVQISWLGYPSPTRIPSIDYIICDEIALPPMATEFADSGEKPLVIAGGFHCYRQYATVEPSRLPPSAKRGYVTFGSFNTLAKLSPGALALWARVLEAVPDSRLILKRAPFAEEELRQRFKGIFAEIGIGRDRIQFMWELPSTAHHLDQYAEIDIALDTIPYNGTTTTCDALWMGVPVVALLGDRWVSRKSASLLQQAGLSFLIARDAMDFVQIAKNLAADRKHLEDLRKNLRRQLLSSPLCDAGRLAGAFEDAFFSTLMDGADKGGET